MTKEINANDIVSLNTISGTDVNNVELVSIESYVKAKINPSFLMYSLLIIEPDNYVADYLPKNIVDPLVLHSCSSFTEAGYILSDNIIDFIIMELFTIDEAPVDALNLIRNISINHSGTKIFIFTTIKNIFLLQLVRSFRNVSIISKYENIEDLSSFFTMDNIDKISFSNYIQDLLFDLGNPKPLNDIEWDVLIKKTEGLSGKDISAGINRTYSAINYYQNMIMKKLRLKNKREYLMMIKSLNTPPPRIFDIKFHHYYD